MNQVPHITKLLNELENIATADWKKWDIPNATANDFVTWAQSRATHTYNEVKAEMALAEKSAQPEPVEDDAGFLKRFDRSLAPEPHAELKAMYEQQVKDGTLDLVRWDYYHDETSGQWLECGVPPNWNPTTDYRFVDLPTCQVRNEDTGKTETMTREKAKKLQAETKDAHDWVVVGGGNCDLTFGADCVYNYKRKANLVKLNGDFMTLEAAIAEWESKKDTCDVYCWTDSFPSWDKNLAACSGYFVGIDEVAGIQYQLHPKQKKQVSWKDMPAGVMTDTGLLLGVDKDGQACLFSSSGVHSIYTHTENLELAPASEQPWIAVQDDRSIIGLGNEFQRNGFTYEFDAMRFRITGIAQGYELK